MRRSLPDNWILEPNPALRNCADCPAFSDGCRRESNGDPLCFACDRADQERLHGETERAAHDSHDA